MAKKHAPETLISAKLKDYEAESPLGERKIVSTKEKGKAYRVKLSEVKPNAVYTIDGNIIKQGNRCDKLVLIQSDKPQNKWLEIFVELKGKGVDHAIEQLKATVDKPIFQHRTIEKRWARIVAQSFPRYTGHSSIEQARDYFRERNIDFRQGRIKLEESL